MTKLGVAGLGEIHLLVAERFASFHTNASMTSWKEGCRRIFLPIHPLISREGEHLHGGGYSKFGLGVEQGRHTEEGLNYE